jgi:pSer/pThr/pTyr-binding forkhead associated (FHA) protein
LASTNGTFVNNERVGSTLVNDGDLIALGNSEMTVRVRAMTE